MLTKNTTYYRDKIKAKVKPVEVSLLGFKTLVNSWAKVYLTANSRLLPGLIHTKADLQKLLSLHKQGTRPWFAIDPVDLEGYTKASNPNPDNYLAAIVYLKDLKKSVKIYAEIREKGADLCHRLDKVFIAFGISPSWNVRLEGSNTWFFPLKDKPLPEENKTMKLDDSKELEEYLDTMSSDLNSELKSTVERYMASVHTKLLEELYIRITDMERRSEERLNKAASYIKELEAQVKDLKSTSEARLRSQNNEIIRLRNQVSNLEKEDKTYKFKPCREINKPFATIDTNIERDFI